jgi:hypothetical protein
VDADRNGRQSRVNSATTASPLAPKCSFCGTASSTPAADLTRDLVPDHVEDSAPGAGLIRPWSGPTPKRPERTASKPLVASVTRLPAAPDEVSSALAGDRERGGGQASFLGALRAFDPARRCRTPGEAQLLAQTHDDYEDDSDMAHAGTYRRVA